MKEKTLTDGLYLSERDNGMFDRYKIVIRLTENEKSYKLELVEYESRYSPAHIDALFEKSKMVTISKKSIKHAINPWGKDRFTLYPFKSGIPFSFRLIEDADAKRNCKKKASRSNPNAEKCVLCGGQANALYLERIWDLAGIICEDVFDDKEHECQELICDVIRNYSRSESQNACNDEKLKNGEIVCE